MSKQEAINELIETLIDCDDAVERKAIGTTIRILKASQGTARVVELPAKEPPEFVGVATVKKKRKKKMTAERLKALRANLQKAREARWGKKKKAAAKR